MTARRIDRENMKVKAKAGAPKITECFKGRVYLWHSRPLCDVLSTCGMPLSFMLDWSVCSRKAGLNARGIARLSVTKSCNHKSGLPRKPLKSSSLPTCSSREEHSTSAYQVGMIFPEWLANSELLPGLHQRLLHILRRRHDLIQLQEPCTAHSLARSC